MGFFSEVIRMLQLQGHVVELACNLEKQLSDKVLALGCVAHHLPFSRSPLCQDNLKAYIQLKELLQKQQYDLVHTHTPNASVCARLAARKLRKSQLKVIYTAHGFHFYKGAPLKNWLLFYPIEWICARWTDVLITINKEDYACAEKHMHAKRVEYVPGVGIDFDRFENLKIDKSLKKIELGVTKETFILVSVGEINKNKNHEVVIRAIASLKKDNIHYIICGVGPLERHLKNLSKELGIESQVHLLGYRKDIPEICTVSDVFLFPSKREGLGLAALEAMATGLPIITSNMHGIVDYSVNGETGYTCSPSDITLFARHINCLYADAQLRKKMGINNIGIAKKYDIGNVLSIMDNIYRVASGLG